MIYTSSASRHYLAGKKPNQREKIIDSKQLCSICVYTHTHNRGESVPWGGSSSSLSSSMHRVFFLDAIKQRPKSLRVFLRQRHRPERQSPSVSNFFQSKFAFFSLSISVRFATAVGQMAKLQIDTGDSSHSIKMRREDEKSLIACDNLSFRLA